MTLWCQSASCGTRFTLHKDGEDKPVQTIDSLQDKAGFLIPHVTHEHAGTYYCLHHRGEDLPTLALYSDHLELSVSDSLPKPTLSAETDLMIAPRSNLSLKCKKPDSDHIPQRWTYLLLKEGNSQPLQKHTTTGSWAKFNLLSVTDQDSGNYRCKYFEFQNPQRESEASSALEIRVKDSGSRSVSIALSCVIILSLFLLAFYHRSYIGTVMTKQRLTHQHQGLKTMKQ
uniref:Ig-like domain-containing protein n=1 Tax=Monodelphis domestica TaxID=13616 RepID=A0A5F8GU57_MONDO